MNDDVTVGSGWDNLAYDDFRQACMSRNRDLDGDGVIDTDEVRWYCPAIDQYGGMWIGENAISDIDARLFTNSTTTLKDNKTDGLDRDGAEHYFSNTNNRNTFWAEEGMAVGNSGSGDKKLNYLKCIRNLESKGSAVGKSAAKYYEYDGMTVDLSRISSSALRKTVQLAELAPHEERGSEYLELSNARVKFKVASNLANSFSTRTRTEWYEATCGETGWHPHHDSNGRPLGYMSTDTPCTETVYKSRTVTYYQADKSVWSGTMTQLGTDEITPCNAAYSEESDQSDKGTWRAPNQRELAMMYIVRGLNSKESCRTLFSGSQIRTGWTCDGGNLNMNTSTGRTVRCVKDVE